MTDDVDRGLLIQAEAAYDLVLGDPARYGPAVAELVRRARERDDREALVVALRAQAWFERSRLANRRARALLDEAVSAAADLPVRMGEALVTRSAVNQELGRIDAAVRDLDRAAGLVDAAGRPDLDLKRASLLHNIGRLAEAAAVYRGILDSTAPADVRVRAANNLGLIESLRGRSGPALAHLAEATALAPAVGPAFVAVVAHNRALVLAQCGRLAESVEVFTAAEQLFLDAELPLGEHLGEHAEVLADLRLLPEARELSQRAADELEHHDVPLMAAEARLRVAQIDLLRDEPVPAIASAAQARALFRAHRRSAWTARATVVIAQARLAAGTADRTDLAACRRAGRTLTEQGHAAAAVDAHLTAGRVAVAVGSPAVAERAWQAAQAAARRGPVLVRLKGELAAALAARLDGDDDGVLGRSRAGLGDLARHRDALASAELRALAAGHGVELGVLGLDVLLRRGSPAQVLEWMERTRAASLLRAQPPAPDAVRDDRAALALLQSEVAEARRAPDGRLAELTARQAELEARIRRATWQVRGAGAGAGRVTLAQIRARLDGRVLVAYGRGSADRLVAVVVDGRRSRLVDLCPLSDVRDERDALQFALHRLALGARRPAAARASAEHALARLRALLVEPLRVPADGPLVVVPVGELHRLPWSALHAGPVSVAPSASTWVRAVDRAAPPPDEAPLLVAGPGLPGASKEVELLAGAYAHPTVLDGAQAGVDAVATALGTAALAHLACHGLLRADNPVFSGLQLADGLLTVHELDLRGIAPHRLVLAACDSAADVNVAGDELLGFVSALLGRGTAGLVASVVTVSDVESVDLMTALHAGLRGGASLPAALHAARAGLDRDDPAQFVNWCAFTAYGAG
ncbi:CHAT domain-containing protein [Pseudonocardia sp. CA-107938]|uniref:CHAT domain-containing protein n=1 Tax=Pseudonocardia sp. CA-107938 TaxID=3240021 RepID=UPI003D8FEA54